MSVPLQNIVDLLAAQYPSTWAVAGDHSGLEVGHPDQRIDTILVALEATAAVVREAQAQRAQLLLTHHPLLYRPLAMVREDQPLGEIIAALLRAGMALFSCHTNLDVAPGGLNDYLAERLELTGVEILSPTTREPWYKLAVFVPVGYEDPVSQALGDAGLGVIGRYSHCSFAGRGLGAFRPLAGAHPFQGEVGRLSRVEESRLEILAPEAKLPAALARLRQVHPYEEVAYDLYPLKNSGPPLGLGRLGHWPEPRPRDRVLALLKDIFGVERIRVWGEPPSQIGRLALCSGSGGDLILAARERGAQVYLTGEVRHHQAIPGGGEGFAVLEVGHFASEVIFMEPWAEQLRGFFREAELPLQVKVAAALDAPYYFT